MDQKAIEAALYALRSNDFDPEADLFEAIIRQRDEAISVVKAITEIVDSAVPPVPEGHEYDFLTVVDRAETMRDKLLEAQQGRIDMNAEANLLEGEVHRLTKERDEARAFAQRVAEDVREAIKKAAQTMAQAYADAEEDVEAAALDDFALRIRRTDVGPIVAAALAKEGK
jgi:hypothetical protein